MSADQLWRRSLAVVLGADRTGRRPARAHLRDHYGLRRRCVAAIFGITLLERSDDLRKPSIEPVVAEPPAARRRVRLAVLTVAASVAIFLTLAVVTSLIADRIDTPSVSASLMRPEVTIVPSGDTIAYTVAVDPGGRPVNVTISIRSRRLGKAANAENLPRLVEIDRRTVQATTGVERWTYTGTEKVGYDQDATVAVTVDDSTRGTVMNSARQRTPAPPNVAVSRGLRCGPSDCGSCDGDCYFIHVETTNFPTSVTCLFNSDRGNVGFNDVRYGANESRDSTNWFGFSGEKVTVTCGGVHGGLVWP
jgi:hypothetical protein